MPTDDDLAARARENIQKRGLRERAEIKLEYGDDWDVFYFTEERDSGTEVIALQVWPRGCAPEKLEWPIHGIDTPPLTRRQLRAFPLGPQLIPRSVENPRDMKALGIRLPSGMGRGRRKPDIFYARVADLYDKALERRERAPRRAVARQMSADGAPYTSEHVRDFLRTAAERGLRTPGRQGVHGGKLTDKGRAILAGDG